MSYRGSRRVDHGPRKMQKSVCAECGKNCEVPFRPTGVRPVYCTECWIKRRPPRTEDRRRRENRERRPSPAPENVDLQILGELKRIRKALEKKTA